MVQHRIKQFLPDISTGLIGLFFILILHIKTSYTLIPILISLIGLGLFLPKIKSTHWHLEAHHKWMITVFVGYFLLALLSIFIHGGKGRELDLPSKLLILLPALAVFTQLKLKTTWILYSIIVATLLAGGVGIIRFFMNVGQTELFPAHMYIQSGGILMSLSLFCVAIAFYFQQAKSYRWSIFSLFACGFSFIACLLNQARGAWILAPVILLFILWINRHLISKWLVIALVAVSLIGGTFAGHLVQKRWQEAETEINQYIEQNNGSTSVGARLDMWKSSLLGIQEKPILGWGNEGVKALRKMHYEQGKISLFASSFAHAHNQYLHDTTVKGILGLIALLGLFCVPLCLFWKEMKKSTLGSKKQLWGILGIIHIVSIMGYCLTQAYLAHNSGMMFFAFGTLLFYGLQKNAVKHPLDEV